MQFDLEFQQIRHSTEINYPIDQTHPTPHQISGAIKGWKCLHGCLRNQRMCSFQHHANINEMFKGSGRQKLRATWVAMQSFKHHMGGKQKHFSKGSGKDEPLKVSSTDQIKSSDGVFPCPIKPILSFHALLKQATQRKSSWPSSLQEDIECCCPVIEVFE